MLDREVIRDLEQILQVDLFCQRFLKIRWTLDLLCEHKSVFLIKSKQPRGMKVLKGENSDSTHTHKDLSLVLWDAIVK